MPISAALLKYTGSVQRATVANDGTGGQTPTWANITGGSAVKCSVQAFGGGHDATRDSAGATHCIWFNGTLSLQPGDRFVFSGYNAAINGNYRVLHFTDDGGRGQHTKVLAKRELQ